MSIPDKRQRIENQLTAIEASLRNANDKANKLTKGIEREQRRLDEMKLAIGRAGLYANS